MNNYLKNCTIQDLLKLSIASANAKEKIIRICEVGSLDKIVGDVDAEKCLQTV